MSYGMNNSKASAMKETIPKGYKKASLQQFTPEQMELLKNSMAQLGPDSFLSKLAGGDQSAFAEMEAPALRQFQGLQGQMASRFSGMGGTGARNSSGFQNTMNQASADFAQQLQGQRMNLRNQALKDLMSMSNELMGQRPYENTLVEKAKQWWEAPLTAAAQGFGQGTGEAAASAATGGLSKIFG
jgi:hypothetical protein